VVPKAVRVNGHKIEAPRAFFFLDCQAIFGGGALQGFNFAAAYALLGLISGGRALFDLHKHQRLAIQSHEIQFSVSGFEPPGDDRVAEAGEILRGAIFRGPGYSSKLRHRWRFSRKGAKVRRWMGHGPCRSMAAKCSGVA